MADEPPAPPYTSAPPPPPAGYAPQAYPNWQPNPAPQYRGPMLPGWLTFGGILVLVGGILILVGFIVNLVGIASFYNSTAANAGSSYAASIETFDALVGVGIFLAVLGWLFHQMSMHRRMGH
jgi:uncharacterized membrane protein YphA (DoxX/SURF4 family)